MDHIRTGTLPRPAPADLEELAARAKDRFFDALRAQACALKAPGFDEPLRKFWQLVDLMRTDGFTNAHRAADPIIGLFWQVMRNRITDALQNGELRQFWREVDGIRDGRDGAYDYVGNLRQDEHVDRNVQTDPGRAVDA